MKKTSNIVIVLSSMGIGGAQRIALVLSEWLQAKSINVSIIAIENFSDNFDIPNGLRVININHKSNRLLPKTIKNIHKVIREESPDIVITMGTSTSIYTVLALLGLSNVLHIISERNDPRHFSGKPFTHFISNTLMRFANGYVFQTKEAMNYFPKSFQKRSRVIPNPILGSSIPEVNIKSKSKIIVTMGRLTKQKNHKMLIDAFSNFAIEYPDYMLFIYGSGELHDQTEEYIREFNLQEKIVLHESCIDVLERIRDATVFVLSSDFEGMPNALMEAMAMGLPCISTDCPSGGPRFLIEDGVNGFLIPVGDSVKLTRSLINLAENKELRIKIGIQAKLVKERLSADAICSDWLNFCNEILHDNIR